MRLHVARDRERASGFGPGRNSSGPLRNPGLAAALLPRVTAMLALAASAALGGCDCRPERTDVGAGAPPRSGTRASLALLAPRAGDTLVEGCSYVIRWSAPAGTLINLGAAMGGKDKGMMLVSAAARPDSLVWRVPAGFVTGFGVASSDRVRLRLEDADSAGHYVETGPFTVTGGPATCPRAAAPRIPLRTPASARGAARAFTNPPVEGR